MAVKGSVPKPGVVVPHLLVRDTATALDFYQRAFSARLLYRARSPSGKGEHLHLKMWDSLVQVSTDEPGSHDPQPHVLACPERLGGSSCVFQVGVANVDEAYERAVQQGATSTLPPTDMFWGDRYAWVRDPMGHTWALSSAREVLSPAEVQARMNSEFEA